MSDLIYELTHARNAVDRNAAAIALADLGNKNAIEHITKLLWSPETRRARGTLLYALSELGAHIDPQLLTNLLISEGYEVQYECLRAIDEGRITSASGLSAQVMRLREAARAEKDEDRRGAMEAAAEFFEDMSGMKTP
jgi:HEAT repeat protein